VILRSKELVTIDVNVPVHLNVDAMRAGDPDYEACRALFNELEFTTLLKDFVRTTEAADVEYGEFTTEQWARVQRLAKERGVAIAICAPAASPVGGEEKDNEPDLPLLDLKQRGCDPLEMAISAEENKAFSLRIAENASGIARELTEMLRDP